MAAWRSLEDMIWEKSIQVLKQTEGKKLPQLGLVNQNATDRKFMSLGNQRLSKKLDISPDTVIKKFNPMTQCNPMCLSLTQKNISTVRKEGENC